MEQRSTWPEPLSRALSESMESKIALGLCLVFLDKLLLCDTSIPVSQFEWTSSLNEISQTSGESTPGKSKRAGKRKSKMPKFVTKQNQTMIIDAQAIEHLDILPVIQPAGKAVKLDGSLFTYLS